MKPSRKAEIKKNIGRKALTEPLTKGEARKQAGARARAEYQPTIGAIKGDIAGSRNRQKQEGEWFNQLGNQANESAAATDASYNQANAALIAHMNAAQQAAQGTMGQIAASNAKTSALTGVDPSLFAPTQAEGAAAANQRQITGAALAAPIAQAGASEAGYLRGIGLNARREGIAQKTKEMSRRDKIKQDLTEARKGRAAKAQANYGDIRGEEFDKMIQNRAFPLEKQKLSLEAQENAEDQAIAQQNANSARINANANAADNGSGKGGRTPSEKHDIQDTRHDARITAKNLYSAAKKPPQSQAEWAAFTQLVASEVGSASAAQFAVKKLRAELRQKEQNAGVGVNVSPFG